MKKALVMTFVLVLGLGLSVFAAGGLSGTLDISASFVPDASEFPDFVKAISMTLEVDYAIGGWTFGSSSGFNVDGFSSQSFTAEGVLGAFSFETTMKFKPAAVATEKWTYDFTNIGIGATVVDAQTVGFVVCGEPYYTVGVTVTTSGTQTPDDTIFNTCWWKDKDYATVVKTYEAVFDEWKAVGSVSIAGVSLEGIFFLEGYAGAPDSEPYALHWDGAEETQTSPTTVFRFTSTPTTIGSGFRFKVGGTAGGMTITSYTYFNLTEAAVTEACVACGYSFARKGTFKIASADCDVTFTEEYLTIEGLSFGCATVDVAVSIDCTGFSSLKVLINDFDLGLGFSGINIDGLLTFETTSKTFTIEPCITLKDACLEFEVALSYASNAISGLNIYGVSFEQTWNGITFSSKTAFDTDNSCLFGKTGKSVTDADNQILVKVPATGLYTESDDPCCEVTDVHRPSVNDDGTGYYDTWCIYTEKYVVWEAFSVEIDGDSCCGGAFDLTVDTYFGDKLCLNGWAWKYRYLDDNDNDIDLDYAADIDLPGVADTVIIGLVGDDVPDPITTELLDDTYEEALTKKAYYYNAAEDTLFAWVQTDVDLEIGIGSAWTLTAGLSIDAYGWNSMSFGFGFEF